MRFETNNAPRYRGKDEQPPIRDYEIGKTLAEKCRYIRAAIGLSQEDLGRILGCCQGEISYIERGFIPENKDKISVINKLYRLWRGYEEEEEK